MCFLIKKIFDDKKKSDLCDRFFVLNQNFLLNMLKLFKIPGFSKFQGKVANLFSIYIKNIYSLL